MGRRSKVWLAALLLLAGVAAWYGFRSDARRTLGFPAGGEAEEHAGRCITVVEPGGRIVDKMARALVPGDEVITADGRHYRVREVRGATAVAQLLGMDARLLAWDQELATGGIPVQAAGRTPEVAVYHTHSSESYVPSDGSAFIPFNGGIYRVGEVLTNALRSRGVGVNHDRTPHDPHDDNAYVRSRKTAVRLLKGNPVAMLDVHRDGIPDADFYRQRVSGQEVSQVRIVVGRQNPRRDANLDFARRMMAYANRLHPGIVKGILLASGDYNQDLLPTALLLEVGTHTSTREEAERGVALFAGAIPYVLGVGPAPAERPGQPEWSRPVTDPGARQAGVWRALALLILVGLAAGASFLVVSAGGLRQARERFRDLLRVEFGEFFRALRPRRPDRRE